MGPSVRDSLPLVLSDYLISPSNPYLHRTYENTAPGSPSSPMHTRDFMFIYSAVNDVCIHPNQGELISCDQAGSIKRSDLSENTCSHELVRCFRFSKIHFIETSKTPAGDIPMRSVTLALDGSCLVAGNNKVTLSNLLFHVFQSLYNRANATFGS